MTARPGTGPAKCGRCGMVAVGFAQIGDDRYCHGDEDRPSCYEMVSRAASFDSLVSPFQPQCGEPGYLRCPHCQASAYEPHLPGCTR